MYSQPRHSSETGLSGFAPHYRALALLAAKVSYLDYEDSHLYPNHPGDQPLQVSDPLSRLKLPLGVAPSSPAYEAGTSLFMLWEQDRVLPSSVPVFAPATLLSTHSG